MLVDIRVAFECYQQYLGPAYVSVNAKAEWYVGSVHILGTDICPRRCSSYRDVGKCIQILSVSLFNMFLLFF